MKTAIVTGADGFIGSTLIKILLSEKINVIGIDIVKEPKRLDLKSSGLTYFCSSIDHIDDLYDDLLSRNIDLFYHFAWRGSAGGLRGDYSVQVENALMAVKCLEFAKKIGCSTFVCAGTIMEYEVTSVMYAQGTQPQMSYIYGVGKQLAHEICKPVANKIGIRLIWTYITNAYGIGELSPRLINNTLRKIINGEQLDFTSGTQNYDFIYVDDVALALYLLGQKGKENNGYLIGSGHARPLKEFLQAVVDEVGGGIKANFGDIPYTGVNLPLSVFDNSLLVNDTGFKPNVSFQDGIKKTFNWLKELAKYDTQI